MDSPIIRNLQSSKKKLFLWRIITMKTLPAILFALGITAVLAITMAVIGANALVNPVTLPITNSPASASTSGSGVAAASFSSSSASSAASSDPAQVAQLQALVTQYQDREKQYQTELADAVNRLNQANTQLQTQDQQIQQFQQLLTILQQRGLIRIDSNGQIFLGRN
jgi:chromosome segregation ATPase